MPSPFWGRWSMAYTQLDTYPPPSLLPYSRLALLDTLPHRNVGLFSVILGDNFGKYCFDFGVGTTYGPARDLFLALCTEITPSWILGTLCGVGN